MADDPDFASCGVCGRTILRGERIAEYATPDGERAGVCALCKSAAEDAGWVPAALAGTVAGSRGSPRRGLGLRQRLSRVSEAARGLWRPPGGEVEAGERESGERESSERRVQRAEQQSRGERSRGTRRARRDDREAAPAPAEGARDQGEASAKPARRASANEGERADRKPRQAQSAPRERERPVSPERRLRAAIERFNASREPRKVAGLIRSLGEPSVAVRPNSGGTIVVTVAWELSWYQWEVRADDNGDAVRVAGKGSEVGELGERDRAWNATAATDGTVNLGVAAAREASDQAD